MENILPNQVLNTTVHLGTFDMHTLAEPPSELTGTIVPRTATTVYGLCGWFSAHLAEGIELGTGPADPPTHWSQIYFPFSEPLEVTPGVELAIRITLPSPNGENEPAWYWSATHGSRTIEMNDIDQRQQLDPNLPRGLIT